MTIDCPKCGQEHSPHGTHEDDSGEWECSKCEFKFTVLVEYTPYYTVSCQEHSWGAFRTMKTSWGSATTGRWCENCRAYDLQQGPENRATR